jgi:hypothetical protein
VSNTPQTDRINITNLKIIGMMGTFWSCLLSHAAYVHAEPLNIEVRLYWADSRNCLECTQDNLRLIVDGDRVFASSVMLLNYSDLNSKYNRAIQLDKSWKCADHTQDNSAPGSQTRGQYHQICVRLSSHIGNIYTIDYSHRLKTPRYEGYVVINTRFSVEILGTTCRTKLLTALTSAPGRSLPLTGMREQTCYFVTS